MLTNKTKLPSGNVADRVGSWRFFPASAGSQFSHPFQVTEQPVVLIGSGIPEGESVQVQIHNSNQTWTDWVVQSQPIQLRSDNTVLLVKIAGTYRLHCTFSPQPIVAGYPFTMTHEPDIPLLAPVAGATGPTGASSVVPGPTGPTGPTGASSSVPGPTGPGGTTLRDGWSVPPNATGASGDYWYDDRIRGLFKKTGGLYNQVSAKISLYDYLSDVQIDAAQARVSPPDVTAELQAAVNDASAGAQTASNAVEIPIGSFKISATIDMSAAPIWLIGAGAGVDDSQAPTELLWYGNDSDWMIKFGSYGISPYFGGGIRNIRLDARQIATRCVSISDCVQSEFTDFVFQNATQFVLSLSNISESPTVSLVFKNGTVHTGITGSNTATGIFVDGVDVGGFSGVTTCRFDTVNVWHDQGPGVVVGQRGDNNLWTTMLIGGQNPEVPGVWFNPSDSATAVNGGNTFIGCAVTCGYRFDGAGSYYGTRIISQDLVNVIGPPLGDPNVYFSGAGVPEVTIDTNIGWVSGKNKTLGWRETITHDKMQFMLWDSVFNFLWTTDGMWKTDVTGGGAIVDGLQLGGATTIATPGATGGHAAIFDTATVGVGGISSSFYPNVVFTAGSSAFADIEDVTVRMGWMDSLADPPDNGMYVEIDPDVTAQYRFVCRNGGVETSLNSAINFSLSSTQFRIEASANPVCCNFYGRAPPNQVYEAAKSITTNIPSALTPLSFVFQIITKTGTGKSVVVYDFKRGFQTEQPIFLPT